MHHAVPVSGGDGKHRLVRLLDAPAVLTDGFLLRRDDRSRLVLDQNARIDALVVRHAGVVTGDDRSRFVGDLRVGVQVDEV